jgi:probable rRNA maturation factor
MAGEFEIAVANRQKTRRLDGKLIKHMAEAALIDLAVKQAELGVSFVSAKEMARVHEEFMNIAGSTDVITFDHGSEPPAKVHGEIFISVEDAIAQAREFKTTWQSEIARYVIHGILHLLAFDDLQPTARKKMKQMENRLVKKLEARFDLRKVEPNENKNSNRRNRREEIHSKPTAPKSQNLLTLIPAKKK